MKQVEVTILGQSYLLACPEGGETLLQTAVASVDREMSGIRDAGKVKARERIAVLAALNLAYRLAEAPRAGAMAAAENTASASPVEHADASEARRAAAAQVETLIAQLDTALSDDGRLL
jgi:cell division protein ZapA